MTVCDRGEPGEGVKNHQKNWDILYGGPLMGLPPITLIQDLHQPKSGPGQLCAPVDPLCIY